MNSSGVHQDSSAAPAHDTAMQQAHQIRSASPEKYKKKDQEEEKWVTALRSFAARPSPGAAIALACRILVGAGKPLYSNVRSLRLQPLHTPAIAARAINQPVMQPVLPPLPELEHLRP